jgi:7-cyano-7-deazaguanine synthase
MKPKAVVVLSGGIDSTTALYQARADGYEVSAISFDYGQRHKKELDYAKLICEALRIPHEIVDLTSITRLINSSSLTGDQEVPEGHYAQENMRLTVVPNRNMIMYAIAIGYAVNIKAKAVYVGVHTGDHSIYPDCRPQFINGLDKLARVANKGFCKYDFKVIAPFIFVTKDEIVRIGTKLGVLYELTWSCYKGKEFHCGRCGTCVERKEAFKLAGIPDPTKYDTE